MHPNPGRRVRRAAARRWRRTAWPVALYLLVAAIGTDAQGPPLAQATADDLARGQHLFDAQCALCHGIGGGGGSGPSLQRPVLRRASDDEALVEVVRRGIAGSGMPGFSLILTDDDAWRVAAYARSLGRVSPEALPGSAARGEALYAAHACALCHIVNADAGGVLGPDLSDVGVRRGADHLRTSLVDPGADHPSGYLSVMVETSGGETIRGVRLDEDVFWLHLRDESETRRSFLKADLVQYRREFGRSLMPEYGSSLSAEELDDLVAYLATLRGSR